VIPPGKYTAHLASTDSHEYSTVIAEIRALAESGDRAGLDELETLIRANSPGKACEFHRLGFRVMGLPDVDHIAESLVRMAKEVGGLFARAAEVQRLISDLLDPSVQHKGYCAAAKERIRASAGERQAHCFELLFSHLVISAAYLRATR
jgi:hypothetical protein